MMLEIVPPGQHPIMSTASACTGLTAKARESRCAVRGMSPNWHRRPTRMAQGRRR
uniref:Uncharacterized protein n=1 Tax=Anguilla anguilla TaxID=7936 RepID=A0A0E9U5L0_ANGAN